VSSRQAQTTAVADIAIRAGSYGIPGTIVDGQDVLAVYETVSVAVARARAGEGPTLVETKTYRYCDHLEGYKFPVYRSDEEVELWRARDPIATFTARLGESGGSTAEELCAIRSDVETEVAEAVEFARQSPAPAPEALVEDLFL